MKNSVTKKMVVERPDQVPRSEGEFYEQLVVRNFHFIDAPTQEALGKLKVLIAGCGSGGGACTEPLARIGVRHFRLADNGGYELSNMNRQRAYLDTLGENKAVFQMKQLKRVNPFLDIQAFPAGITPTNVRELVEWSDIVIDAVDVTTPEAIRMKLALHKCAKAARKPTFSALDVGFCQWGKSYDYRDAGVEPLDGRLAACETVKHPIKALFTMFPLSSVPGHSLQLVVDLLTQPGQFASQLGCASDLLSAVIAAVVVRYADCGEVAAGWNIDLESLAMPWRKRLVSHLRDIPRRLKINRLLRKVE